MCASDLKTTIYIGQSHSGSWSSNEALQAAVGGEHCYEVDALTFAKRGEAMPDAQWHIAVASEAIRRLPQFPTYIHTHVPLPLHIGFPDRNITYITALRNPVARFIAHYSWIALHRHMDVHWVYDEIRNGATLDEFVDCILENNVLRGLAPAQHYYPPWDAYNLIPEDVRGDITKGSIYVLEKYFSVVGLTEMFDETLYVFAKHLDLKRLPRWRMRGNSGAPKVADVSVATREKIEGIMAVDITIYNHFKQIFLTRHQREIEEFRALGISLRIDGDDNTVRLLQP